MNPKHLLSWIGIGHSFSLTDETDSAMASYRTGFRLFPGSHYPLLYIGMEYLRTNSLNLAEHNIQLAKDITNNDPIIYNELGVIYYKSNDFKKAITLFEQSINLCNEDNDEESFKKSLEISYFNIGHCFRKLEMYDEALNYYEKVQKISYQDGTIESTIGFTHHLKGDLNKAIEHYHKALSFKNDDSFSLDMLSRAFIQTVNQSN